MKLCMELFFPNGNSEFAGDAKRLNFRLINFKNEKIEDILHVCETEVPFTITNYIRAYQTNKVRLYLTSSQKIMSIEEEENEISVLFSVDDNQMQDENASDHSFEPEQQVNFIEPSAQR